MNFEVAFNIVMRNNMLNSSTIECTKLPLISKQIVYTIDCFYI